jgi:hypothetical protein
MKAKPTLHIQNEVHTNTVNVAENLEIRHVNLLRTVKRLIRNGMEDCFFEKFFTNKQGRTYPMYEMTTKGYVALETIYLMSDSCDRVDCELNKLAKENDVVYFITNNNGSVKIGYTSAIRTRLSAIQLACDTYCEIIATIKGGKELEKQAHEFFKEKRLSGEWFSIDDEDICDFVFQFKLKANIRYYETIRGILYDLWNDSDESEEPNFDDIYKVNTKEAMTKVLMVIKYGMEQKMHYKDIYHYAKEEVNKLADVLIFTPKKIRK